MRAIEGIVYRVKAGKNSFLVETNEASCFEELCEFCAEKTVEGHVITSVTRVYVSDGSSPRVSVLGQPEYKAALKRLQAEKNP